MFNPLKLNVASYDSDTLTRRQALLCMTGSEDVTMPRISGHHIITQSRPRWSRNDIYS
jgi:hypothetical protein